MLLAPYNYVVSNEIRKTTGLGLKDKIIVFDEGHNIVQFLEESSSLLLEKCHLDKSIAILKCSHDKKELLGDFCWLKAKLGEIKSDGQLNMITFSES